MWQGFLFLSCLHRIAWRFSYCINLSIAMNREFTIYRRHVICRRWGWLQWGVYKGNQYRVQAVEYVYVDNFYFFVEGLILRNSSLQTTYIYNASSFCLDRDLIVCKLAHCQSAWKEVDLPTLLVYHFSADSKWPSSWGCVHKCEQRKKSNSGLKGNYKLQVNISEAEQAEKPVDNFNKNVVRLKRRFS